MNSGSATFTHLPFTISQSCSDVMVYHSYSRGTWPNYNPTVTYNATTYTFTWTDSNTYDAGNIYPLTVTAIIGTGQSAIVKFNLIVVRECYFASIFSYTLTDVSYDVS